MSEPKYAIILEPGANNWSAFSPNVPGCVATGETAKETLDEFLDALDFHLANLRSDGDPMPAEYSESDIHTDADAEYVCFRWAPVEVASQEGRIKQTARPLPL